MQANIARSVVASRLSLTSSVVVPHRSGSYNSYVDPDKDASPMAMHTNPFIARYRKRPSVGYEKQSTGLTGLFVNETPHRTLTNVYTRILHTLEQMPADAVYRTSTESIVRARFEHVKSEHVVTQLEEKIGMGQIEEVIEQVRVNVCGVLYECGVQAQYELVCARNMLKNRVWESLIGVAPVDQWRWPI